MVFWCYFVSFHIIFDAFLFRIKRRKLEEMASIDEAQSSTSFGSPKKNSGVVSKLNILSDVKLYLFDWPGICFRGFLVIQIRPPLFFIFDFASIFLFLCFSHQYLGTSLDCNFVLTPPPKRSPFFLFGIPTPFHCVSFRIF